MKQGIKVAALAAILAAPAADAAMKATISGDPNYRSGSGGEFTITPAGSPNDGLKSVLPYYADAAKYPATDPQTGFQTFCIEYQEFISLPGTYYVEISNTAKFNGPVNTPDPISKGTAYLYYMFAQGSLEGDTAIGTNDNLKDYRYTPGTDRAADAALLQQAIWYLEGEPVSVPSASNWFYNAAINEFGSLAAAQADNRVGGTWQTTYKVQALNLWTSYNESTGKYSGIAQDQLVVVPEPATYFAAALLGLPGLLGLLRISRRSVLSA